METRANYLLIGVLTLLGFLGIMGFLMWFAKVEFDRQFDYYDVYFPEVSGLSRASQVRFAGLPVGQVLDMTLAEDQSGRVRVRLEVTQGTPVREDSVASLELQGVTGVALIGISAGSSSADLISDADGVPVIPSAPSALQALSSEGPEIIARLSTVSEQLTQLLGDENQSRVANILDNVERSSGNLDQAITDVSDATAAIAETAGHISAFGDQISGLADAVRQTLGNADLALARFTTTAGTADAALVKATDALAAVQVYVEGDLADLTRNLDSTSAQIGNLAARGDATLDGLDAALDAATRTFEGADAVISTDIAPVTADLRDSLGTFNAAVETVNRDLPGIMDGIRGAADSADAAFASLRTMLDGARAPVQSFTRDGLVQFTAVARDARDLVENLNQLVTTLRRNPAQVITGPRQPEFRR